MYGGFTPCPHLRPYSGREHTIFILIPSSDDDDDGKKNEKETKGGKTSVNSTKYDIRVKAHFDSKFKLG